MDEPDSHYTETKDISSNNSTLERSLSRRSTPGRSISGRSTPGRSLSGRSTPEPPPVPPATYHWDEVRKKRSKGGYPWTHLDKPIFDENTWIAHERDHVYEPVTPSISTDRISSPTKQTSGGPSKDEGRHFLRIPLTEELVMADDTGSEPETEHRQYEDQEEEEEEEEEDEEDDEEREEDDRDAKRKPRSEESIYEGENENSSAGEADTSKTRMKIFQQKVKVKADVLRAKLQGVTKRKPKQKKIAVDSAAGGGEKGRRKFGQFATLPKKFTFNAPKVNFSAAFGGFSRNAATGDVPNGDETRAEGGRFSMPRFGFARTSSSESPKPAKSTRMIGTSRISIPGFRPRTWSDASKTSRPEDEQPPSSTRQKLMEFGTYPRMLAKRMKAAAAASKSKTPPPQPHNDDAAPVTRKDSFRRRFFQRSHKESTPAPTDEQLQRQTATLAVEEETDEVSHVSKESLAEFGDSDLQEVISLTGNCGRRSSKDTKSLSEHRPGVIEEIDSDEFFLREKGLSRGDVHISNYLSSEIRDVFRSNRTRSVEGVNGGHHHTAHHEIGTAIPVRPSRTNSLRRPMRSAAATNSGAVDRFSTMPKSFGSTRSFHRPTAAAADDEPENIITSQTFEPSSQNAVLPSAFKVPWRKAENENVVTHMPPKPPARQRVFNQRFATFDTRSMIDLSRKRSQSQIGFSPSMNFSETAPKAPLRRSRTSLADSDRETSVTSERPWGTGGDSGTGAPTPPLRRSRMSLTTDADTEERSAVMASLMNGRSTPPSGATKSTSATPPRPPPPVVAGYATVDKTPSSLIPPQSPMRHRRKKSYEVIKSQEFGAFFTIPRSYAYRKPEEPAAATPSPIPSRPARAYNTLGPSRPHRRRLPHREHEYGDVSDNDTSNDKRNVDECSSPTDEVPTKALFSGDVIEKMKLRPLPSPPPPPRKSKAPDGTPELHRRNTDSAVIPFLDQRETSAASSDFFADVSRALQASQTTAGDDVSVGIQTDPLPDGYELDDDDDDDNNDGANDGSDDDDDRSNRRSASRTSSTAADRPVSRTMTLAAERCCADRPTSRTSMEYVDRPASRNSNAAENGYVMIPADGPPAVICAQRINVNELEVAKLTVGDIRSHHMGVGDITAASGSCLKIGQLAGVLAPPPPPESTTSPECHHQDDAMSVQSRVSSMYPEVDSEEDRTSVLAAPTPPRRRSKPSTQHHRAAANGAINVSPVAAVDPTITELSCQLFRLCHSNVCSLFNKVVQQVVPEDTEKRRDLQAALCFLSIILAGLLILGFGNEKTIHHHHWDFQFPPPNQ